MFNQLYILTLLIFGLLFSNPVSFSPSSNEATSFNSEDKVYEMRTYTTHEGKLQDLHDRFRNHSMEILANHGMESVAYWVPQDPELSENTLIYIITHESRDVADENWQSFFDDPEWQEVYEESHEDGPLVDEVVSVFMKATPYSPLQ